MGYLIEFERCQQDGKPALAVRIIDPAGDTLGVIAEAIFPGDLGIALTGDQNIVVLRLPLTNPKEPTA